MSKLRRDTLYFPEYATHKMDVLAGDESQLHDLDKLMEHYPYKYKIVSSEQMDDLILNSEKPVHVLVHVRGLGMKWVAIFNSQIPDPIYHNFVPVGYNLKPKDFKRISKEIR